MNDDKPKILIVDDNKSNRLIIKSVLKNEGYDFLEAENGKEAIEIAKATNPDIILLDALMPIMDGFETTKVIRTINLLDKTPILMITSLNSQEDMIKALECGVNDFIPKPFSKEILLARCRSYISYSKIIKKYSLATQDPISGLPNKISLMESIEKCKNPKLMLIKIRNFYLFEEFYGMDIAMRIKRNMPSYLNGILPSFFKEENLGIYHTNDDEFAVLGDDLKDKVNPDICFKHINELIKSSKKKPLKIDEIELEINITVSFACMKERTYENARIALNHALKENINVIFANEFIKPLYDEEKKTIEIVHQLKYAVSTNNILTYLQPIFNNKTKKIEKYESLVRLRKDNGEILSPFFFLDVSKSSGYYSTITKIMLWRASYAIKKLNKSISINFSASDLENDKIKEYICDFLHKNRKISGKIIIELLEDETYKNINEVIDFTNYIKKNYSVKISIDDFGSGYSNLSRIIKLQPDFLKIDGSIVKSINKDNTNKTILKSIIFLSRELGIKTVGEFVETKEILDTITKLGVDYSQGYYISPPLPFETVLSNN